MRVALATVIRSARFVIPYIFTSTKQPASYNDLTTHTDDFLGSRWLKYA